MDINVRAIPTDLERAALYWERRASIHSNPKLAQLANRKAIRCRHLAERIKRESTEA
jgi:hypothetical protein